MSPSDWPRVPLIECYEFRSGLSKPRSAFGSGFPFLTFKDVFYNIFVPAGLGDLVESTPSERARGSIRRGDVFLTRTSETMDGLGMSCVALADRESATFNGFTKRLRPKPASNVVPEYAGYYFRSPSFRREITAMSSLSTRASLNNSMLAALHILLPPVQVQKSIGMLLGALDDKIDLNRRMNETLEAMARALFKSWFVDFDPVRAKAEGKQPFGMDADTAALFPDRLVESELGLIPEGWEVKPLGHLASTTIGGDWGKDNEFDGAIAVRSLRGVDIGKLRQRGDADPPLRWIKEASLVKRCWKDTDLLVAASGAGPCGRPLWCAPQLAPLYSEPLNYSNFVKRLRCESAEVAVYVDQVFHTMRLSEEVWDFVNGTSVPNLDMNGLLAGKRVVCPPNEILRAYFKLMHLTTRQLYSGESRTLADLRDLLLPKLLSGEIRVNQAEEIVEAAL